MTTPHQEASKLGQFSWALFDWANQPFFTVVTTFIFAPYFANVMVGNAVDGQAAWAFTQSTSGILIALMSPFLGAMADAGGKRKPYIFTFQLLVGLGCAALWWAHPGRPDLIGPISVAVIVATIGAEMSIVFNNAQLPHIVRHERMGWLSGFGWGLGYCGGLVALFIVLAVNGQALAGQTLCARAPGRSGFGPVARRVRDPDVPVHAGYGQPETDTRGSGAAGRPLAGPYGDADRALQERAALSRRLHALQ